MADRGASVSWISWWEARIFDSGSVCVSVFLNKISAFARDAAKNEREKKSKLRKIACLNASRLNNTSLS